MTRCPHCGSIVSEEVGAHGHWPGNPPEQAILEALEYVEGWQGNPDWRDVGKLRSILRRGLGEE